ncbi:MAG TPA: ParA family protein [Candidatus Angelobacter sp.]|jgi:cellulose biosynthesis protein BcsQ
MTTISLISGKGGAGKTSVALSLAQVLTILNYKVLLVDLDSATHGASYFFEAKKPGLEEWILSSPYIVSKPKTLPSESNKRFQIEDAIWKVPTDPPFSFIASKSQFQTDDWDVDYVASNAAALATGLERLISAGNFDFLIFDCQAGVNIVTAKALELSQCAIIVMEADSVSTRALRSLQNQFSHILPRNTKALINKLFLQEKATYDQLISVLRNLEFLPPIPFDMDVRDAFARNLIPLQTDRPSSYFSSILRVLKELLPDIAPVIAKKTAEMKNAEFGNYEKELAKLEETKARLVREREESLREIERAKERTDRVRRLFIPVMLTVLSFLPYIYERYFGRGAFERINLPVVVAAIGMTIGYIWVSVEIFWRSSRRKLTDREHRMEEMTAVMKELDERIDRYNTLYLTEQRKLLF